MLKCLDISFWRFLSPSLQSLSIILSKTFENNKDLINSSSNSKFNGRLKPNGRLKFKNV